MITHISKLDEIRNDTLISRAEGQALNRLSRFYGFERPLFIRDENWRSALKSVVFGARGTLGILFDFMFHTFKEFIDLSTYEMACTTANRLEYTGSANPKNLEGRLIKISGTTHFITHTVSSSETNGEFTATFHVAERDTTYFKKLPDLIGTTFDVQFLPYVIEEHKGKVNLVVDAGLFIIPSTYLHDDASPVGGYILDYFSSNSDHRFGDQSRNKTPVYLLDELFQVRFFEVVINILASGIQLTGETLLWSNETSIYASLTNKLRFGSVAPDTTQAVPTRS